MSNPLRLPVHCSDEHQLSIANSTVGATGKEEEMPFQEEEEERQETVVYSGNNTPSHMGLLQDVFKGVGIGAILLSFGQKARSADADTK